MSEVVGTPSSESEYVVLAVETIHQSYAVRGKNPEHAAQRLRRYMADPDIIAPGIVMREGEGKRVRWQIRGEKKPKK